MDPVSILAITNASFAIARSLVHTIKELYELAEAYETAALGIRTVATQCDSFRIAIQRINKWLQKQDEASKHDLDEDFWQALQGNVETGRLVLEDLEKRIQGLKKNPAKFWIRTKYLWNGVIIAELQSQVQGLMAAVSILLQVIDIPTPEGKRSRSVAQKQRLNGLTVRNRNRAVEQHRRMQESQEQNLLDGTNAEQLTQQRDVLAGIALQQAPSGLDDPFSDEKLIMNVTVPHQTFPDVAPPPYDYYVNSTKSQTAKDLKDGSFSDQKRSTSEIDLKTSSPEALEKTNSKESKESSGDKKAKRPMWKAFMKRSSKQEPTRSLSDLVDRTKSDNTSPPATPPVIVSQVQETPAAIETPSEQENYFQLQAAMSGMSMTTTTAELTRQDFNDLNGNHANPENSTSASELDASTITTPPDEKFASNNPYKQMRLEAQLRSESNVASKSRPNYHDLRSDSTDNFSRIRPSHIVREARERSQSRGTTSPPEPLSRQSTGGDRLGSINFGSASDTQQTWQTTTLTNRTMKFKIQFEKESFTNKISASAARALGVYDTIEDFAGIPITHLTLLYTVSDGLSAEADTVLGDEAEFVVMDEHESGTPLVVLGAASVHLARIAEEGQYVYWSPGAVPENVRGLDRLRLFRRFELVRW